MGCLWVLGVRDCSGKPAALARTCSGKPDPEGNAKRRVEGFRVEKFRVEKFRVEKFRVEELRAIEGGRCVRGAAEYDSDERLKVFQTTV